MAELKFPTKKSKHDIYFVLLNFYKLGGIEMSVDVSADDAARAAATREKASQLFTYEENVKKRFDGILLPLQTSVPENVNANYSETSTKNISAIANAISDGGSTSGAIGRVMEEQISKKIPGLQEAISLSTRRAINEQMKVIYEGPSKRKYSFEFTLMARNNDDSKAMVKIKNKLQYHASPSRNQGGSYFNYPNMVKFEFLRRGPRSGISSEYMDNIESLFTSKFCYVESVSVTNGDERYQEFMDMDGNIGPSVMKISLELLEAEYMLQEDFVDEEETAEENYQGRGEQR